MNYCIDWDSKGGNETVQGFLALRHSDDSDGGILLRKFWENKGNGANFASGALCLVELQLSSQGLLLFLESIFALDETTE